MRELTLACATATWLLSACATPAAETFDGSAREGETTLIERDDSWLAASSDGRVGPIDTAWNQIHHTFFLDDPEAVGTLRGEVLTDEAAVVYLNGVRIDALEMPAPRRRSDAPFVSRDWTAARAHLRNGANVIAVELHGGAGDKGFALALYTTMIAPTPPGEDIARRSVWAYRDGDADLAWRMPGHDDRSWARGKLPLGSAGTTWYRRRFRVADAAAVTAMLADVRAGGTTVVYLNGSEVRRLDMPSGDAHERLDLGGFRSLLVDGDNLIAVEVQRGAVFDLALDVTSHPAPPSTTPGIARGATWMATTSTEEPGSGCRDWLRDFDDRSWLVMRAPIGYGAREVRSVLPGGPAPAYFRGSFSVDDPQLVRGLFADLLADGAVLYLNGAEVARRSTGGAYQTVDLGDFIRELKPGKNVVAVRVQPSASDLVFDAAIRVELKEP